MKKLAIISTFILGLATTSCNNYLDINENQCPVSDQLADTVISLPIHPYLSEADQDKICDAVSKYLK